MSAALDASELAKVLTSRLRLGLQPVAGVQGQVRIADIASPNGFAIRISPRWRSVEATFVPDTYSGPLIWSMASASSPAKEQFLTLLDQYMSLGMRGDLRVNGARVTGAGPFPDGPWSSFEFKIYRLTDKTTDGPSVFKETIEVGSCFLGLLLTLLPTEEISVVSDSARGGLPEGARKTVVVNRYERSAANRAACIARFGPTCAACGFDFELVYGDIGVGYIEVHHITPVSKLGPGYVINPFVDLVPLCSNCHSVVHLAEPPLSIAQMKALLNAQRVKQYDPGVPQR